jgi:hypothetical protein
MTTVFDQGTEFYFSWYPIIKIALSTEVRVKLFIFMNKRWGLSGNNMKTAPARASIKTKKKKP